jgi:predicted ribosomally synthesized peptide with nif11-like leader
MMSLVNATSFLSLLDRDTLLLAQVNAADWDTDAMIALAGERGYAFSEADLEQAIDNNWGVLTEEELANAAGGVPGGSSGHQNPPPGHTNKHDGWAPPPGDVSGNSCFFGWRGR